MVELIFAILGM